MRPAIIAAFITNLHHRFIGVGKQLTGMADTQVLDKIEIGFLDIFFKKTAEGGDTHRRYIRYLLQGDGR